MSLSKNESPLVPGEQAAMGGDGSMGRLFTEALGAL